MVEGRESVTGAPTNTAHLCAEACWMECVWLCYYTVNKYIGLHCVCVCVRERERERERKKERKRERESERPWPEVISASGSCWSSVPEDDPLRL